MYHQEVQALSVGLNLYFDLHVYNQDPILSCALDIIHVLTSLAIICVLGPYTCEFSSDRKLSGGVNVVTASHRERFNMKLTTLKLKI